MGYTHYMHNTAVTTKPEEFVALKEDCLTLLEQHKDILANGMGEADTSPTIGDTEITFNGIEEDSHETMTIPLEGPLRSFEFCKTAYKPYDKVVVASLFLVAYHLGAAVDVSSDGGPEDWQEGLGIALSILPQDAQKERALQLASIENGFTRELVKKILEG